MTYLQYLDYVAVQNVERFIDYSGKTPIFLQTRTTIRGAEATGHDQG
jgi:hypothetical protein